MGNWNGVVWGKQIKPFPQPLEPLFEGAACEGYDLVEWRSPTKQGTTVSETDLMALPEKRMDICQLRESYHRTWHIMRLRAICGILVCCPFKGLWTGCGNV